MRVEAGTRGASLLAWLSSPLKRQSLQALSVLSMFSIFLAVNKSNENGDVESDKSERDIRRSYHLPNSKFVFRCVCGP